MHIWYCKQFKEQTFIFIMVVMWARFRFSKINKDKKEFNEVHKSLNVNEEYCSALRTKSYADFFTKAQYLVNEQCWTSSLCYNQFFEDLLEPRQEKISMMLESPLLCRNSDLKNLLLKYFDISAEASKTCSHLLNKICQIQHNYRLLQQSLEKVHDDCNYCPDNNQVGVIVSDLSSLMIHNNPFSTNPENHDFKLLHDEFSLVLRHILSKKKKVVRKIKLIECFKKTSGVCVTATCSLIAIAAMVLAAHTLTTILMGPAILSFPFKNFKKKVLNMKLFKNSGHVLRRVSDQLDVAAKGTYILKRDFDTMSRLITRVHDEIEYNKGIVQLWLSKRDKDNSFSLVEAIVKELKKNEIGFRNQIDELEEHLYLCLVTINRARALVFGEITSSSS